MSGTRPHRRVIRVQERRPGAAAWKRTRYFVVRYYAEKYARRQRVRGYEVRVCVAALGPWHEVRLTAEPVPAEREVGT